MRGVGETVGWHEARFRLKMGPEGFRLRRESDCNTYVPTWFPRKGGWGGRDRPSTADLKHELLSSQLHLTYLGLPQTLRRLKSFWNTYRVKKEDIKQMEVHKSTSNFMKNKINQWKQELLKKRIRTSSLTNKA